MQRAASSYAIVSRVAKLLRKKSVPVSLFSSKAVQHNLQDEEEEKGGGIVVSTQSSTAHFKDGPSLKDFLHPSRNNNSTHSRESSVVDYRQILKQLQQNEKLPPHPDKILLDSYNRNHTYLRISLTERCNLRCTYCMPSDGVPLQPQSSILTTDEILRLASVFASAGVTKIRLTGGEPFVRKDLMSLVKLLSEIPGITDIGITTNGLTLAKKLPALLEASSNVRLNLNVSLDTLDPYKFKRITRRSGHSRVLQGIKEAAATIKLSRVKVNVVVMRGVNDNELVDFVKLSSETDNLDVRFIEWMPFDSNKWNDNKFMPYKEMLSIIKAGISSEVIKLQDGRNDTSKAYNVKGSSGQFGFITSMSEHFCGTCNRLRITADGSLKVCLFGNTEVSLRDAMREPSVTNSDLRLIINAAVQRKKFALGGHGDMYGLAAASNRPMILIGG